MYTVLFLLMSGGLLLIALLLLGPIFSLWLQVRISGASASFREVARVGFTGLRLLTLRIARMGVGLSPPNERAATRFDVRIIMFSLIRLHRVGVRISLEDLERHALAGGDVAAVTDALLAFRRDGLELEPAEVMADDLRGIDVVQLAIDYAEGQENEVEPRASAAPGLQTDG
ncbi:MAG: hypothetical protein EA379_01400 [Phycisphaerales bacterium]|nr:MAG: hypothetical protein EA379_01400 [Phycisphaerales bacterium]